MGLGLAQLPRRPRDALVDRLAFLARRARLPDGEDRVRVVVTEYLGPDLVHELEPLVRTVIARQWRIAGDRARARPPGPSTSSSHERKCDLALRLLGGELGYWLDVRIEGRALLAVARPGSGGALGYRLPGTRPGLVALPVEIKTVSDALGWLCLSDIDDSTAEGLAFREWITYRQRAARSRRALL